jgi:flagellin
LDIIGQKLKTHWQGSQSKFKEECIMVVQHNITSMNSNRQLGMVTNNLQKSTEKLSSGYRINRAADDAAGLSISEKMRSQIRGLNRASDNAQDGISLVQTAEGAMEQQHAILQRARELVVQASNTATLDADSGDYQKIQDELDQLKDEFNSINSTTEYNKKTLLDGNFTDQYLQVGANSAQGINISITSSNWDGVTLVTTGSDANSGFLDDIDDKITAVSTTRSNLGAIQNRLEYRVKVDDNTAENLQSAESLLRDTDMAEEMTRYSKESILQQAATSMLAQANQANQSVLSLLQ